MVAVLGIALPLAVLAVPAPGNASRSSISLPGDIGEHTIVVDAAHPVAPITAAEGLGSRPRSAEGEHPGDRADICPAVFRTISTMESMGIKASVGPTCAPHKSSPPAGEEALMLIKPGRIKYQILPGTSVMAANLNLMAEVLLQDPMQQPAYFIPGSAEEEEDQSRFPDARRIVATISVSSTGYGPDQEEAARDASARAGVRLGHNLLAGFPPPRPRLPQRLEEELLAQGESLLRIRGAGHVREVETLIGLLVETHHVKLVSARPGEIALAIRPGKGMSFHVSARGDRDGSPAEGDRSASPQHEPQEQDGDDRNRESYSDSDMQEAICIREVLESPRLRGFRIRVEEAPVENGSRQGDAPSEFIAWIER